MLQKYAVDGLVKLKGLKHEDTLSAMGSLGRTIVKFYENLNEAKRLLQNASDGMSEVLGPTHLKALDVKEDLAMLVLQMEGNLSLASEMMQDNLDCRKDKLSKEHPCASTNCESGKGKQCSWPAQSSRDSCPQCSINCGSQSR